jgi:uncharacterized membrane protein YphA (DoxX/SURF4 family)
MNIALWVVQGILALMFIMAGIMKTTKSKENLLPKLPWVKDFSVNTVKLIGTAELLAALCLVLPMLLDIFPVLTSLSAIALSLIMIFAMVYHYTKKEIKEITFNLVILIMTLFVTYGRI